MANLNSTRLAQDTSVKGQQITVASVAGISKGDLVYVDGEAMRVTAAPITPVLKVQRGQYGTAATEHAAGNVLWSGKPTQFHSDDPKGKPLAAPLENPWINMGARRIWFAIGDEVGPGVDGRYWQLQAGGPVIGALGVRPTPEVVTPTASS